MPGKHITTGSASVRARVRVRGKVTTSCRVRDWAEPRNCPALPQKWYAPPWCRGWGFVRFRKRIAAQSRVRVRVRVWSGLRVGARFGYR